MAACPVLQRSLSHTHKLTDTHFAFISILLKKVEARPTSPLIFKVGGKYHLNHFMLGTNFRLVKEFINKTILINLL